ncbi:MAG: hypothetical protein V4531_15085 [Actinomycetota bacterium]
MTIRSDAGLPDEELFARLRRMWSRRDPIPAELVDNVLVALETHDLGTEYAMLTLLESSGAPMGMRAISDVKLLEFSHGERSIMMRVSDLGKGRRRIDGWISPAAPLLVRFEQDDDDFTTAASAEGRFDFSDLPAGRTRMWVQPEAVHSGRGGSRRGFTTDYFIV